MSKVLVSEENLTNIANAIREKNGETTTYKPGDMAGAIQNIFGGGSTVTKGIIINEFDENGYATDVSVVGMTSIPDCYFAAGSDYTNCLNKYLKNVQLPNNLTSIGHFAFNSCINLALTELLSGITSIGNYAFSKCPNLALTKLPNGITSIGDYVFNDCTNLALTELPSGITSIGKGAFHSCTNLALTELPNNLTSIGNFAFQWCRNLALTELPSGITSIGERVFQDCISLIKMSCLGNITSIANHVFYECTNLSIFALPNITRVPTLGVNVFANTPIANGTGYIYVPDNLVESFKSATNWSRYADQIKAISEMGASA